MHCMMRRSSLFSVVFCLHMDCDVWPLQFHEKCELCNHSPFKWWMVTIKVVSLVSQFIKAFYNKTWIERYGEPIAAETVTLLWSITVSIFAIGGLLGALSVSSIIRVLGRWVNTLVLIINSCWCNTDEWFSYSCISLGTWIIKSDK